MPDTPNFATWSHTNLARFALEQYLENQRLREVNEQLRLANKNSLVQALTRNAQ